MHRPISEISGSRRYFFNFEDGECTLFVNLEYARYENACVPNGILARKPGVKVYEFAGRGVTNDFENGMRTLEE